MCLGSSLQDACLQVRYVSKCMVPNERGKGRVRRKLVSCCCCWEKPCLQNKPWSFNIRYGLKSLIILLRSTYIHLVAPSLHYITVLLLLSWIKSYNISKNRHAKSFTNMSSRTWVHIILQADLNCIRSDGMTNQFVLKVSVAIEI